ncbi:hypothetical protein CRUP_035356 [Coryphaenoides rupestris]|nr:hypothetical protein CRUP_035356 [Coryphaenoides rupestris]
MAPAEPRNTAAFLLLDSSCSWDPAPATKPNSTSTLKGGSLSGLVASPNGSAVLVGEAAAPVPSPHGSPPASWVVGTAGPQGSAAADGEVVASGSHASAEGLLGAVLKGRAKRVIFGSAERIRIIVRCEGILSGVRSAERIQFVVLWGCKRGSPSILADGAPQGSVAVVLVGCGFVGAPHESVASLGSSGESGFTSTLLSALQASGLADRSSLRAAKEAVRSATEGMLSREGRPEVPGT